MMLCLAPIPPRRLRRRAAIPGKKGMGGNHCAIQLMNDLQTFFSRLAVWEGLPAVPLVARWNLEEAREIGSTFRRAFDRCRFGANPLIARWAVSSRSEERRVGKECRSR